MLIRITIAGLFAYQELSAISLADTVRLKRFSADLKRKVAEIFEVVESKVQLFHVCLFENEPNIKVEVKLLEQKYLPNKQEQMFGLAVYIKRVLHFTRFDFSANIAQKKVELKVSGAVCHNECYASHCLFFDEKIKITKGTCPVCSKDLAEKYQQALVAEGALVREVLAKNGNLVILSLN